MIFDELKEQILHLFLSKMVLFDHLLTERLEIAFTSSHKSLPCIKIKVFNKISIKFMHFRALNVIGWLDQGRKSDLDLLSSVDCIVYSIVDFVPEIGVNVEMQVVVSD